MNGGAVVDPKPIGPRGPRVGASGRWRVSGPISMARTRRGPAWAIRGPVGRACSGLRRLALPPQPALLAPVEGGGDGQEVGQDDGIAAAYGRRQKQQRFLNVRS